MSPWSLTGEEGPFKKKVRFTPGTKKGQNKKIVFTQPPGSGTGPKTARVNAHAQTTTGKLNFNMNMNMNGPSKPAAPAAPAAVAAGAKRKADNNAAGGPNNNNNNKRPRQTPPACSDSDSDSDSSSGSGDEGEQKPNKKKKRANKKRKNKNVFTSADEPLLEQAINGTVPEGVAVPDRVRRKLPDASTRILYAEREGNDHKWDMREELLFQKGGTEAQKAGDRPLPIYHAIAHPELYSDELVGRMMEDYVSVHREALDGCWGRRWHDGDYYPPPLWFALLHGRWPLVEKFLDMGARPDKVRYGNLEHLQARSALTKPCKWEGVPHARCTPKSRLCCTMYNYLAWSLNNLLKLRQEEKEEEDAASGSGSGSGSDFDERMSKIEQCMLNLTDRLPGWIQTYDSSGVNGKAFYIAPLILAGFFRLLDRVQVRENMSAAKARSHLETFIPDAKRARRLRETLSWFRALPEGRGVQITSHDYQRLLAHFAVPDFTPPKGNSSSKLVQGEEGKKKSEEGVDAAYAEVSVILESWSDRVPNQHELDDYKTAEKGKLLHAWGRELNAAGMDSRIWEWLVRLKNADPARHGDPSIRNGATWLLNWQQQVLDWMKEENAKPKPQSQPKPKYMDAKAAEQRRHQPPRGRQEGRGRGHKYGNGRNRIG
ncbi:hypothetical protein PG996_009521 [Apiospora saccharicola]|uniref:Ankyrin repeat protein n=1 Tax=Apiospora saccharicola TaxID=335842 RepID=A0ABR1UL13_9PEZI